MALLISQVHFYPKAYTKFYIKLHNNQTLEKVQFKRFNITMHPLLEIKAIRNKSIYMITFFIASKQKITVMFSEFIIYKLLKTSRQFLIS